MRFEFLIIMSIFFNGNFLFCNGNTSSVTKNKDTEQDIINNSLKDSSEANDILRKVENRYYTFTFYKAKAQNLYSKKGFKEETSIKREIEIEYTSPSQINVTMRDDKSIKTLISKNNNSALFVDGEKIKEFDDVLWGLTSTEFGDGSFFEVGKLLILKERGQGEISSIRNLHPPLSIDEEIIDERVCYKIQGLVQSDSLAKITYWIDKESFLIRQYERLFLTKKIPNGYFKTIETYTDIEAN